MGSVMTSLGVETWSYGALAAVSSGLLAMLVRDALAMRPRPAAALVQLALTASLTLSAVVVFVAAYLRLVNAGMLIPEVGTALRGTIAAGIAGALTVIYWWRFWR